MEEPPDCLRIPDNIFSDNNQLVGMDLGVCVCGNHCKIHYLKLCSRDGTEYDRGGVGTTDKAN